MTATASLLPFVLPEDWIATSRFGPASTNSPTPPPKPANDNQRFDLTWFDDIDESEPRESVIQGVIGVGELSSLSGLPGSGKSIITTDAACHVAAGIEWHGRRVKQGLVVYIAAERKRLTQRRMQAWRIRHEAESVPLLVVGGRLDLTTSTADARAIVEAVKAAELTAGLPCVWIVIDTLTRTFGPGDQNTSKDMGRFIRSCDLILEATGAHVTVIHHTAWTGERGKGAIDLDGAVDSSFLVKKTGSTFNLICNGTNDGEEGPILGFGVESVTIARDHAGESTVAPVVVGAGPGVAAGFLGTLKGHVADVLDALKRATAESGVAPEGDHFPEGVQVVTEDQWRATYYASLADVKPDTAAKRFKRARAELLEDDKARVLGQWYWVALE